MREERLVNSVMKRATNTTLNGDIQLPKFDTSNEDQFSFDYPIFTDLFLYARDAKVNKSGMHHVVRLDDKESEEESVDLYISENHEEIQVNYNKRGKKIPVVSFKLQNDITDTSKKNVSVVKIDKNGFPDYNNGKQIPATTEIMDVYGFNDVIWWKHIKYGRKVRDFLFDLLWRFDIQEWSKLTPMAKEEIDRIAAGLNDPARWEMEEAMPQYTFENINLEELPKDEEGMYTIFNFSGVFYVPKVMNEKEFCEALQKSVNVRKWKINGTAFPLMVSPKVAEETPKEVANE